MTDTKTADRRQLTFASLEEVSAELDRIESAIGDGMVTTTGNWTVGQNLEHLAKFLQMTIDGFPSKAPPPVRWIARLLMKNKAVGTDEPFPAGFKLPKQASALLPSEQIADQEGMRRCREQLARVAAGEEMLQPSPLLGKLTHDEWLVMHRKHFALHLSFLTYPGA